MEEDKVEQSLYVAMGDMWDQLDYLNSLEDKDDAPKGDGTWVSMLHRFFSVLGRSTADSQ